MIKILFDGSNWVVFRDDAQFVRLDDAANIAADCATPVDFAEKYDKIITDRTGQVLTSPERAELRQKLAILFLLIQDGFV